MKELKFSSFSYAFFLYLVIYAQMAWGDCICTSKTLYLADDFGYMVIDQDTNSVDIFKYIPSEDAAINIANCKIEDITDTYMTISSLQPMSYKELDIQISEKYSQYPDSVVVTVRLPESETKGVFIRVSASGIKDVKFPFSNNGTVEFNLKKPNSCIDDYFSVMIFSEIIPFKLASSRGDSETLSFLDLSMILDERLDLYNPELSEIDIHISNFTSEIFSKWVVLKDFVLKDGKNLIWRNISFYPNNTSRF